MTTFLHWVAYDMSLLLSESKTIMSSKDDSDDYHSPYGLSSILSRITDAGVPVVPGYHGSNQDPAYLLQEAATIGDYIQPWRKRTLTSPRLSRSH